MLKTRKLLGVLALVALVSCTKEDKYQQASELDQNLARLLSDNSPNRSKDYFLFPESDDFAAIPQDPKNPLSEAKVKLGKFLFHETGLGVNPKFDGSKEKYSCASCHHVAAGFQAGRRQGISDGAIGFGSIGESRVPHPDCPEDSLDVQPIRSPSAMNLAYQEIILWNGQFGATGPNANTQAQWTEGTPKAVNQLGFQGLETQAIAGLNVHRLDANKDLFESTDYKLMFKNAFGNIPSEELYTKVNIGRAIAAYERTLVSREAPFQKWLQGNFDAMTDGQKRGAALFFGKANCVACHSGPALANMEFHAVGMDDFEDNMVFGKVDEATKKGRGGFTKNPADNYKFKVPQLYNLKDSPFYGHGGSFTSVEAVVNYKNRAVKQNPAVPNEQLANTFIPLGLSAAEVKDLTDFIENGLYDPNLDRFVPDNLPSGLCFPFADSEARKDLGCE